MRLIVPMGTLLLFALACKSPVSSPVLSAVQIWAAQVQEAVTKPMAALPEKERADYAQGFENGAGMVRKALDAGRKPYVLLPGENARPPRPKGLGPLPEGVTLEPEALEVELDAATGLPIMAWGSVQGQAYSRGQKEGFAWALAHHGPSLVQPRPRPSLPEHWQHWPKEAPRVKLETPSRDADVYWAGDAILWKAAGQGFPGQRRWRPVDEGWRPRFVALQEDVLWLDTMGHGAVALDLDSGFIRELKASPNPPALEVAIDAKAAAERVRIEALRQELDPVAMKKRWQERANTPKAQARRQELHTHAKDGDLEAMFLLALELATLDGPEAQEAATWLQTSAERGHVGAMSFLGAWHYEGRCVVKSEALAREWLEKAAQAGDLDAKVMLASLFGKR